jgi:hypothetical protein
VEWQIKNPYHEKQLAVRMLTLASVPIELVFSRQNQQIHAEFSKIKVDLLEYKPYFKSEVPLKAIQ